MSADAANPIKAESKDDRRWRKKKKKKGKKKEQKDAEEKEVEAEDKKEDERGPEKEVEQKESSSEPVKEEPGVIAEEPKEDSIVEANASTLESSSADIHEKKESNSDQIDTVEPIEPTSEIKANGTMDETSSKNGNVELPEEEEEEWHEVEQNETMNDENQWEERNHHYVNGIEHVSFQGEGGSLATDQQQQEEEDESNSNNESLPQRAGRDEFFGLEGTDVIAALKSPNSQMNFSEALHRMSLHEGREDETYVDDSPQDYVDESPQEYVDESPRDEMGWSGDQSNGEDESSQSTMEYRNAQAEDSFIARASDTIRSTFSSLTSTGSGDDMLLARLEAQNRELRKVPTARRVTQITRENVRKSFHQARIEASQRGSFEEIDWEFWGLVISDFKAIAKSQPKRLSEAIQAGIPSTLRGMIWQLFAWSKDPELEMTYKDLLKRQSPYEKMITRDLNRTFPGHEFFKDEDGHGQRSLFNVLRTYSIYDEEVGYCQGIGFIVGPLLLCMPEEEAFCLLVRLMKQYGLRSHFTPQMDGLQLRLFQLEHLMEEHLPRVYRHITRQGVKPTMYASQWFMTLFAYKLPLSYVFRIFDVVLAEGVDTIFRFVLVAMKRCEDEILGLEFEQLLEFLKGELFEAFENPNEMVQEAYNFKITPKDLSRLTKAYHAASQRAATENQALEALRQANNQLSNHVKRLEASLATLNREHCELANVLISTKMELARIQEENQELQQTVNELNRRVESQPAELEQGFRNEIQEFARKNADLVHRNSALENQLGDMESMLIDVRVRYAESENERESLKRKLNDLRKALGVE
ncbi:uncharacterized protein VTP21DRAFT_10302 [Calcarisporiella thermophila]|uniref:uncharacterized protein n=1 Tax=Calcarisporiella thermophila TaxID=911321 RepID=UPI003742DE5F